MRKIFYKGLRTVKKMQDPYYQGAAAEMGFYFIFSIIPIMTILLQLLGFFDIAGQLFQQMLERFSENAMAYSILNSVQTALGSKVSLAFLVVAMWSASKIEFSMIRMANYTYRMDGSSKFTGYFKARFRAIITTAALILMVVVSLLVLVYGDVLINILNALLHEFLNIKINVDWLFSMLRWPIALVIYWFFLALNYSMLPNKRIPFKKTIPGSLFAAVGILLATMGYYIYFQNFSNLNLVYGSLAAIIALLLWFYWLSYILIVGMILNAVWFDEEPHYNF